MRYRLRIFLMFTLIFWLAQLSVLTSGTYAQKLDTLFVFECDTARFGVYYGEKFEEMKLYTSNDSYLLQHVIAASGARYANKEETIEFWNKGEKARINFKGRKFQNCTSDARELSWFRARLECVSFRAIGQEPGWLVEIKEQQKSGKVLLDYGTRQLQLQNLKRAKRSHPPDSVIFKTVSDSIDMTIKSDKETCQDPMNGNQSPYKVTVTVGDENYKGCGRFLDVRSVDKCN